MDMTLVAEGLHFPEGPIAMADGSVLLVEIQRGTLTRIAPDGTATVAAELGGGPNGAAIGPDAAVYVCNNGGSFAYDTVDGLNVPGPTPAGHRGGSIQRVDLATGEVRTLYTEANGRRLNGPNDLVFDRTGGFWFTDHGTSGALGRTHGGLFYARSDGSAIACARDHMISPNGVGLSPDEDVVYMADTMTGRLWAFDVESPGVLKPPAAFGMPGRVVATLPGYQLLDSLAVEAEGRVCVATIINGGITVFDPRPEANAAVEHTAFPDPIVTNICFGGADMRDAWITCSGKGNVFRCRWPRPGLKLNYNG